MPKGGISVSDLPFSFSLLFFYGFSMAANDSSDTPLALTPDSSLPTTPSAQNDILDNDTIKAQLETNEDYQAVLATLNVLKHQLTQATKDIDTLTELKKSALEDPVAFVNDLKCKKKRRTIPTLQRIVTVPEINWSKYKYLPESRYASQAASLQSLIYQYTNAYQAPTLYKNILETPMEPQTIRDPADASAQVKILQEQLAKGLEAIGQLPAPSLSVTPSVPPSAEPSDTEDEPSSATTPAGPLPPIPTTGMFGKRRLSTQTGVVDPETRTTPHERRLEELLQIYPDEPVQNQRFIKISKALGTRTPKQVGSRIQKYFIKLAKMGLPVPGRYTIPPTKESSSVSSSSANRARAKANRARARGRGTRPVNASYASFTADGQRAQRVSGGLYIASTVPSVLMEENEDGDAEMEQTMRSVATSVRVPGDKTTSANTVHQGYAVRALCEAKWGGE
ncbi:hypothetical protein BC940DRAFT_316297 [Gongronella butleri]|nr:hypothetical protein BC940DRAFT_316297 [Gongronella butleri]